MAEGRVGAGRRQAALLRSAHAPAGRGAIAAAAIPAGSTWPRTARSSSRSPASARSRWQGRRLQHAARQSRRGGRPPSAFRRAAGRRSSPARSTIRSPSSTWRRRRSRPRSRLDRTPELSLVQQGELLFYDARLSHDGWMSCQSCHTDGHANGQMNDNFSDRSFGAPKRVLSLLGVKDTLPLAWSGQVQTLERQIHNSVESTMQRDDAFPLDQARAIAAYVQTLELPPSLDALRGTADRAAIARGKLVFERHDCAQLPRPADLHFARGLRRGTERRGRQQEVQSAEPARALAPRPLLPRQQRRHAGGCLYDARASRRYGLLCNRNSRFSRIFAKSVRSCGPTACDNRNNLLRSTAKLPPTARQMLLVFPGLTNLSIQSAGG